MEEPWAPPPPPPEPPADKEKDEEEEEEEEEEAAAALLNVGGWCFSLPRSKLAQFPESLLWQAVADSSGPPPGSSGRRSLAHPDGARWFLDRDGSIFRHLHAYLRSAKLSFASCAQLPLLYEQATLLRLRPLLQTLDNLKEGKHNLRIRPADIPIAERASMNYWRTRKCISKPSEFPLKSPAFTGLQEKAPLGLIDTPLLDTEEEVPYCFLPLDLVEKYPSLVSDDNLLWLCDGAVLIECESNEFRFIANFLRSEKILLPHNFSNMEALEAEAEALGIPEVTEAVKNARSNPGVCLEERADHPGSEESATEGRTGVLESAGCPLLLYPLVLGLLVKYPDSALGQLHMESTLDGNKLYISGNGVLFQHIMNWLGTCRLPLTRSLSELPDLCAYLDQMGVIYEPMKDALKTYLKERTSIGGAVGKGADWAAELAVFPLHHIVKVYVGSHWYATYLQTLLKFPELLSNRRKASWIAYGHSLLIYGDGQMFRHILNFLRLGKLFLPSDFKEWPLLCQEVTEYQIPSLVEALHQYETYRLWTQQDTESETSSFRNLEILILDKEHETGENAQEEPSHVLDLDQGASPWGVSQAAPGLKVSDGENEKSPRLSPAKGAKRKPPWEASAQPLDGWGGHPCSSRPPESPPRKRGAKGHPAKRPEARETPMQKLISLVQGWDMVSHRQAEVQPVPGTGAAEEEESRRPPCHLLTASPEPSSHGFVIRAAPQAPGSLAKAGQPLPAPPGAEGWHGRLCLAKEMPPLPEPMEGSQKERGKGLVVTFREHTWAGALEELQGKAGLILKVEHPPVVGCDGSCVAHEGSILYIPSLEEMKLGISPSPPASQGVVFLSFPLSQEEIFYARKCHAFLTDLILDSIRQKDSRDVTARVEQLVQRLWRMQISAKEFVASLLAVAPFKGKSPNARETLRWWVEFTLPLAQKYSCCVDLLLRKGYFASFSHFVIEKYLHKP